MEQKKPKFRLRLNLFDGIVLVVALAAAALMGWMSLKTTNSASEQITPGSPQTVWYTIRFQRWAEGTSSLIQLDDQLIDNGKNLALGKVVSVEAVPARIRSVDREKKVERWAELEGLEDVLVTIESPCLITDESITISGSYEIRVGQTVYVKGIGYLGAGPIVAIEEEGMQG